MEATKRPRPRAVYLQTQATAAPIQAYRTPDRVAPTDLPSTRYQGSKRRLSAWLHAQFKKLEFDSALDVFSGSGSVAYLFKLMGKKVVTNDFLQANRQTSLAFIVNDDVKLTIDDVDWLTRRHDAVTYRDTIAHNFGGVFYLYNENSWLDMMAANIQALTAKYHGPVLARKRALAYWALFQSCLAKRPFNLFHRANLNLRTADVARQFGNKVTWDKPFPEHFRRFVDQANARVFGNGLRHETYCTEASRLPKLDVDLVYL
ncbi:MAG: DNA adenine methylase, partial [candidate division WOR-3 bacterium]|nr:DNA adenine methylase [candidate division WOR-3 bacterium]